MPDSPKSDRQIALDACDDAFEDFMKKAASTFQDGLLSTQNDQGRADCRTRLENALKTAMEARKIHRQIVDQFFPQ